MNPCRPRRFLLRRAQDPVIATLDAAPYDDADLTDEDLRAVKEAREAAPARLEI
jgi:hypothetical protein